MVINQGAAIVAEIANQLIGANYFPAYKRIQDPNSTDPNDFIEVADEKLTAESLTAYNPTIIADIGKVVSAYAPARDIVYNSLVDQITKIVIDSKLFTIDMPDIVRDVDEFGAAREVVEIGISNFMEDPMWEDQSEHNYLDPARYGESEGRGKQYAKKIAEMRNATYMPKSRAKVYGKGTAVMVALSIFRNQLFTATRTWDEIDRIVAGMINSVTNALRLKTYDIVMDAICTGIAIAASNGNCYNVLKEAHIVNVAQNVTTATNAMTNANCQRFFGEFVANKRAQMQYPNAFYNDHYNITQTAASDIRLLVNAQWANRLKFTVLADTFHNDEVGFGDFKKVASWQGIAYASATASYQGNPGQMEGDVSGTMYTVQPFRQSVCMSVRLDPTAVANLAAEGFTIDAQYIDSNTGDFKLANVVAFMYDRDAIQATLDKPNVFSDGQNPVDGKTNMFWHNLFNVIVQSSKQMMVFYWGDDS